MCPEGSGKQTLYFALFLIWGICLYGSFTTPSGWLHLGFAVVTGIGFIIMGALFIRYLKGAESEESPPEERPYVERKFTGPGETGAQILTFRHPGMDAEIKASATGEVLAVVRLGTLSEALDEFADMRGFKDAQDMYRQTGTCPGDFEVVPKRGKANG